MPLITIVLVQLTELDSYDVVQHKGHATGPTAQVSG